MTELVMKDAPYFYRILYIHQMDTRSFNRGAIKNIGFLAVKELYPVTYRDITLVFNDVDTVLSTADKVPDFRTVAGKIRHYYGFTYALGGMFSILAGDFEDLNGFPNFWTWGYEDNMLANRADKSPHVTIDRSIFYPINDPAIIQIQHGSNRTVNAEEYKRFVTDTTEGIDSIKNVVYRLPTEEHGEVGVLSFDTGNIDYVKKNVEHDLRNGPKPFNINVSSRTNQLVIRPSARKQRGSMSMQFF
jgi:hypothetical protein